jgi:hypothetical protein
LLEVGTLISGQVHRYLRRKPVALSGQPGHGWDRESIVAYAKAEARRRTAESEIARYRVAMRRGLTEAQARRLLAETEDDFDADARQMLAAPKKGGLQRDLLRAALNKRPPLRRAVLKSGSVGSGLNEGDRLLRTLKRKLGIR